MAEITLNVFLNTLKESIGNEKRFCFILGSGASRGSGISTGVELAKKWMEELHDRYQDEELMELKNKLKINDLTPSSDNYFDIYKLRFYPDYHNGAAYLEKIMEGTEPSLGYYPLAKFLTETENNLVITTNFDSLVEDALFIYTDKKPIVASHEALAEYINISTKRPIIAKVHRGLFFEPLNNSEDLAELSVSWKNVLKKAFQIFTPIVIGYAGGDHTLMDFLKDDMLELPGIYWCYKDYVSEEIKELVEKRNGVLVPITGFDEMMFMLGRKFKYENPRDKISSVAQKRIENYNNKMEEFSKKFDETKNPSNELKDIIRAIKDTNDEEIEKIKDIVQKQPNAENYALLAKVYKDKNKRNEAIQAYNEAIKYDTTKSDYYFRRGSLFGDLGKYDSALNDYNQCINMNINNDLYYFCRSTLYNKMGKTEKRIEDLSSALDIKTDNHYLLFRAQAYEEINKPELAIQDYLTILDIDPDNSTAYLSLGYIYEDLGKEEEALSNYINYLNLKPLGELATDIGKKAMEQFKEFENDQRNQE